MVKEGLIIQGVSKSIKNKMLVEPFDLTLEPGKVLALCGGNGAGKSTILRMISGIIHPSTGTISIDGVQWKQDRKVYAEKIGYMPDEFHAGLTLTAKETLSFYASLRKLTMSRVDEVLELVGLTSAKNNKISSFSKGMRQRLMFAQSLLANPPFLLLDEPTNGLDPHWMGAFVQLVLKAKKSGQAIILSTHQLDIAEEVADKAVFLYEGRILRQDPVEKFTEDYGTQGGLQKAFAALLNKSLQGGTTLFKIIS